MAKIRKNLSDADMLRGFNEEITFENGMYAEDKVDQKKLKNAKQSQKKELFLTEDAQERLNRFLLEISMEWIAGKKGSCSWKVLREGDSIVIKPAPVNK